MKMQFVINGYNDNSDWDLLLVIADDDKVDDRNFVDENEVWSMVMRIYICVHILMLRLFSFAEMSIFITN